ncbi:ROK family transcriptional regulator [Actinospica sp. MGRD01-02]|uniref:ROK family transcriptional regulator n=1 Tax=Actinospica acidithermotolerans TaxID=2828514 RepID=A0A941IJP5_9ACTN|nr:ROK family transcriptional regulator [Actinospica acidithermotolerans]MBR7831000.1 ROK family transcriptional regulator [Actinospica acidithermotolerans]
MRASELLGEATRAEIFGQVLTAGPISRSGLAARLGLSPSTVTRLLPPLLEADYIREEAEAGPAAGPGRPQRLLSVNLERHLVVGLKIAPSVVSGVVTDMGARVLARAELQIDGCAPETALTAAGRLVRRLLAGFPDGAARTLGVGVGLGGHVDAESGICRYSGILGWRDVAVAAPIAAATGLPVVVGNDVNALVVAQHWFGAGRENGTFAVVTIGAGIGCGLLVGGALFTGSTGLAAEFGHIPIDPAGPVCTCGRRGCLEALACSGSVLARLGHVGLPLADIEAAAALARAEPATAEVRAVRAAFAAAGDALGRGLATLCNLINPELVILAGEGVSVYDLLRPAVHEALSHHAFSTAAADCTVLVDPVDDDMWTRGAACLVLRATVRAPLLSKHHPPAPRPSTLAA